MTNAASAVKPLNAIAEELLAAESGRLTVEPVSNRQPLTLPEAYQVQQQIIASKLAASPDERWKGLKAGLTSKAKQKMVNIDEPIFGQLLASNIISGRQLRTAELNQPRVEPEVGLYFSSEVTGEEDETTLLHAIGWAFPALEILDSRYANYKFSITDVVADNASTARVVLGDRVFTPTRNGLANLGVSLFINGTLRESGTSSAVLGHPLEAALWVARKWRELGHKIPAGSILLTGGMTTAIPIQSGDAVVAMFQDWGTVHFHCA